MMVLCCICRRDVSYIDHWSSSIYTYANECKKCRNEEDLVCLPLIIKRVCHIQDDFTYRRGMFSTAVSPESDPDLDPIYNEFGMCIFTDPASICYIAFEHMIETKVEEFIWNAFKTGNYLESHNKIYEHEIDMIKLYFVRNMPSFTTRENIELTDSTNMLDSMTL